jgi:serine/threonine protein kinase
VDGRADQYALACMAFSLLTRRPLFGRDQPLAVLMAHLSEPPPSVISLRRDLPAAADRVLSRVLAKSPEDRYPSCGKFAGALRDAPGLPPCESAGSGHPLVRSAQPRRAVGPGPNSACTNAPITLRNKPSMRLRRAGPPYLHLPGDRKLPILIWAAPI